GSAVRHYPPTQEYDRRIIDRRKHPGDERALSPPVIVDKEVEVAPHRPGCQHVTGGSGAPVLRLPYALHASQASASAALGPRADGRLRAVLGAVVEHQRLQPFGRVVERGHRVECLQQVVPTVAGDDQDGDARRGGYGHAVVRSPCIDRTTASTPSGVTVWISSRSPGIA